MPQNGMIYEGRRRGTRRYTWKASGQAPATGLLDGVILHNGEPAATTRASESTPACTLNGTSPQCMVNGYINHRHTDKSKKAPPPGTPRKQESTVSATLDAPAYSRVSSAAIPGRFSANGATSLEKFASPCNSDQIAPEPTLSASAKKQRRWKNFGLKKRPPPMPPHEEEDWEKEIQDGISSARPNGPDDVFCFALRDLTLKRSDTADLPLTAGYCPAAYHPQRLRWSSHNIPTEPDQFADADA